MILLAIGGDPALEVDLPRSLPLGSVVVAADSGLDRLLAAGLPVHHVIGDLDSVSADALDRAVSLGAAVDRYPADKDATDIELALSHITDVVVAEQGLTELLVVGAGGGRLDHLLADILALGAPPLRHLQVTARLGAATVTIVRAGAGRALQGVPGEQVSLLPLHGLVGGVTTRGLRWALVDADLVAGTTRAMSNELLGASASVRVRDGVLAAVQPGTVAPPIAERTTPYDPTPRAEGTPP